MQLTVKPNPLKGKNALLCFKSKGVFKFNNAEVSDIDYLDIELGRLQKEWEEEWEKEQAELDELSSVRHILSEADS